MVTAVLGRKDFVKQHPDLVFGMLRALFRATAATKCELPDVIQCAVAGFNQKREIIIAALDKANEAAVFPASPVVQKSHWDNACNAYHYSVDGGYRAAHRARALEVFERCIAPHRQMALKAMQAEVQDHYATRKEQIASRFYGVKSWSFAIGLASVCTGLCSFAMTGNLKAYVGIAAICGAVISIALQGGFRFDQHAVKRYGWYLALAGCVLAASFYFGDSKASIILTAVLLAGIVNMFTNEFKPHDTDG
jgi:hypothetical protein